MGEIWKPVTNYEGLYEVSSPGKIKSLPRATTKGGLMKTYLSKNGYECVRLSASGKTKVHYIHRLIAESFLENHEKLPCVNHRNGVKSVNKVNNLEWCSYSENMSHSFENNLHPKGEKHYNSRLSIKDITEIKESKDKQKDLATKYGVTQQYISEIKRGIKRL